MSDGKFRDSFPCPTIILIILTLFFRVFAKFRFLILSRARVRANLIRYALSPLLFVFRHCVIYPVILTLYLLFLSQCDSLNTKSDLFVSFLQSFEKMKNRRVATVSKIIVIFFRFQPRYDAATDCPSLRKFSSGSKILNFLSAP